MYIPHSVYPFTCCCTFRLFPLFGNCEQCCCEHWCTNICLSPCFQQKDAFVLQNFHPEKMSSQVSIISNLSWSTTWTWCCSSHLFAFIQSHTFLFFAYSVCVKLHFPDVPALWLPGSSSQCKALERDWGAEEGKGQHISSWITLLLVASRAGTASPGSSSHWNGRLGFQVLPTNPDF